MTRRRRLVSTRDAPGYAGHLKKDLYESVDNEICPSMTIKVHQTSKIKDVMVFVMQYQFQLNICIEKTQFIQPSEYPLIMSDFL